jgi:hypothetical protein
LVFDRPKIQNHLETDVLNAVYVDDQSIATGDVLKEALQIHYWRSFNHSKLLVVTLSAGLLIKSGKSCLRGADMSSLV